MGKHLQGVNFASQDYLNLASYPDVIDAACRAAKDLGVHGAGSASLMGGSANKSLSSPRANVIRVLVKKSHLTYLVGTLANPRRKASPKPCSD